ncbi:RNA polymerase sigma factor [Actinoplanes aureus]|uniref:Sigma-70 family RNA polymerase sigma factor n=1 Tax=Actinoplanes aureus TaxID=2792083 RepID=A0A931CG12_9ACTN|nr:sigma-70 family RNA polymerase sigma factor [Actinoplanes aureus]MBG0569240.1 sigma-70 family RNA polymerase sigma factor [Actinoplanes aureus]
MPDGATSPPATALPAPAIQQAPASRGDGTTEALEAFYQATYRILLKQARYAGANVHEAEDAAAATMADVYEHWHRLDDPPAWARQAVVRFYLKAKTRNLDRVRARQVRHGVGTPHGCTDARLNDWEEWQYIKQMLLNGLTADQREVVALVLDGYGPTEIAGMIGATPQAVRQRLSNARRSLVKLWTRRDARLDVGSGENTA